MNKGRKIIIVLTIGGACLFFAFEAIAAIFLIAPEESISINEAVILLLMGIGMIGIARFFRNARKSRKESHVLLNPKKGATA